jgi:hypothetical protein
LARPRPPGKPDLSRVFRRNLAATHAQAVQMNNRTQGTVRREAVRVEEEKTVRSTLIVILNRSMTKSYSDHDEFVTLNRVLPRKLDATTATHPAASIPLPRRKSLLQYSSIGHQTSYKFCRLALPLTQPSALLNAHQ